MPRAKGKGNGGNAADQEIKRLRDLSPGKHARNKSQENLRAKAPRVTGAIPQIKISCIYVFQRHQDSISFAYLWNLFIQSANIFAEPLAQRRVGIPCGWSNGQRVLLSIDPGDPSRPETWRCRISGGTCSTLWRSTARFFNYLVHQEGVKK